MGFHQDNFERKFPDADLPSDPTELKRQKALRKRIEAYEEEKRLRKELDDYDDDYDWGD